MTEIVEKGKCCGCGACSAVCPQSCIEMIRDEEGFLYPHIDSSVCIDCGQCKNVCPVLHADEQRPLKTIRRVYAVQNSDNSILKESTSGGAFTAFAENIIDSGGVVFGAALDDQLSVSHISTQYKTDLHLFRNSKYVQSSTNQSFRRVKVLLGTGEKILYSGTPCQISGLLDYLRKPDENLLTIDVVCRAVPSPLALEKYLELRIPKHEKRSNYDIRFRDKKNGYEYPSLVISEKTTGREICRDGIDTDPYLRAFFSGMSIRPSCLSCVFRPSQRRSDITLWDCFDVNRHPQAKPIDNGKGVTNVLIHTEKGLALLESVRDKLKIFEVDAEKAIASSREMHCSPQANPRREEFLKSLNTGDLEETFNRFFPYTIKTAAEKYFRLICHKLGIYRAMKQLFVKITGFKR